MIGGLQLLAPPWVWMCLAIVAAWVVVIVVADKLIGGAPNKDTTNEPNLVETRRGPTQGTPVAGAAHPPAGTGALPAPNDLLDRRLTGGQPFPDHQRRG